MVIYEPNIILSVLINAHIYTFHKLGWRHPTGQDDVRLRVRIRLMMKPSDVFLRLVRLFRHVFRLVDFVHFFTCSGWLCHAVAGVRGTGVILTFWSTHTPALMWAHTELISNIWGLSYSPRRLNRRAVPGAGQSYRIYRPCTNERELWLSSWAQYWRTVMLTRRPACYATVRQYWAHSGCSHLAALTNQKYRSLVDSSVMWLGGAVIPSLSFRTHSDKFAASSEDTPSKMEKNLPWLLLAVSLLFATHAGKPFGTHQPSGFELLLMPPN